MKRQLEVLMEDCLIHGDISQLVSVLRKEGMTHCMLTRLDQLVQKQLSGAEYDRVGVVLKSLEILVENKDDLKMLLSHGIIAKVLLWFQTLRDVLIANPLRSSAQLLTLIENFYDFLLVRCTIATLLLSLCFHDDTSPLLSAAESVASARSVARAFPSHMTSVFICTSVRLSVIRLSVLLLELLQMVLEPEVPFTLRLEAIRTFNSILESVSRDQRRRVQMDHAHIQKMSEVAATIQTVGDYELQVSLSEALCRLTPRKARVQRANEWFSCCDLRNVFCDIKDADFEVDCRHFLNFMNQRHGDQRRVHTFPCLRAFLETTELFPPKDEKLNEFWVDFNYGSQCVSFFIDVPEGFLWGSVHLQRDDVVDYKVQLEQDECTGAQAVLSVQLNVPIMHLNCKGQRVKLLFLPEFLAQLEVAAGRVFIESPSGSSQDTGGASQAPSTPAGTHGRLFKRKKQHGQLKVLPLSSPSSDEDSLRLAKRPRVSRASILFDRIRHSTPSYSSGRLVEAEPKSLQEETLDISAITVKASGLDRKQPAGESGYLSDGLEGRSEQQRKAEPEGVEPEGEEIDEWPCQEEEEEEEKQCGVDKAESSPSKRKSDKVLEVETAFHMTSSIQNAFSIFKTRLEQHYTVSRTKLLTGYWCDVNTSTPAPTSFQGCLEKVESEVLSSLKDCQEHISSLFSAVHQQRLVLIQNFEKSITDQLKCLEESSSNLNNMCSQIVGFFQTEMKRLSSFCDQLHQKLTSMEDTGAEPSSSQ
uniref:synaptonemal complex protein 2-like isoform X3 n=1 Tax=Doryrhamphus excisus TaxID=161450 RepID=UPI0025AE797C|nr:synaptonemal complex protein 2-like isoform X3 [Doryrhamphus excisus]